MTAIAIVRGDNAIAIASDGAAYDDDGYLMQIVPKVDLYPHLSLVIASSGSGLAAHYFRDIMFWRSPLPQTFDDVLEISSAIAEEVLSGIKRDGAASTHYFSLYLCGYSQERQRLETYGIKSREWPDVMLPDGTFGTAPAFTMVPLPEIHLSPAPPAELAEGFGIKVPGVNMTEMPSDGTRYAMASVAACRFALGGFDHASAKADPYCCVGGFLQITTMDQTCISTNIVHRWPDVLGDRMDIEKGEYHERAPVWLLAPLPDPDPAPGKHGCGER